MKMIWILLMLTYSYNVHAQNIIIFDKQEVCFLNADSVCETTSAEKSAFLNNYKEFLVNEDQSDIEIDLTTPPLEWGKKVNDETHGKLIHQESFKHGFVTRMSLSKLAPDHNYRLTLNGNPELDGNELLADPVPGLEEERYYDFLDITTNAEGNYSANLAIRLKPGKYHVRFYVKDMDDWKIVLYHDYFRFTVE
ncbi:hypothetical protein HQ585_12985 [candidate division KSB1 bacterium]|nr:hypothetical protein [candidate division KSB1 bacterium]